MGEPVWTGYGVLQLLRQWERAPSQPFSTERQEVQPLPVPRPAPRPLTASPENRLEEKEEKEVRNTSSLENNTHVFNTNTTWGCNPNSASRKKTNHSGGGWRACTQSCTRERIPPFFCYLLPQIASSQNRSSILKETLIVKVKSPAFKRKMSLKHLQISGFEANV